MSAALAGAWGDCRHRPLEQVLPDASSGDDRTRACNQYDIASLGSGTCGSHSLDPGVTVRGNAVHHLRCKSDHRDPGGSREHTLALNHHSSADLALSWGDG